MTEENYLKMIRLLAEWSADFSDVMGGKPPMTTILPAAYYGSEPAFWWAEAQNAIDKDGWEKTAYGVREDWFNYVVDRLYMPRFGIEMDKVLKIECQPLIFDMPASAENFINTTLIKCLFIQGGAIPPENANRSILVFSDADAVLAEATVLAYRHDT